MTCDVHVLDERKVIGGVLLECKCNTHECSFLSNTDNPEKCLEVRNL